MAFKEVLDLDASTTIALGGVNKKTGKKNPTRIEGYYVGFKKVESKKARSGFANLYIFQTPDGNVGVWGKTDLDRKMTNATVGAMTRVTQTGMLATPNGEMYKYKVEVDAENAIEVATNSSPASNSDEATPELAEGTDPYSSDDSSDQDLFEDAAELDEAPPARTSKAVRGAAAPDAARKARVEALLANGSKVKA